MEAKRSKMHWWCVPSGKKALAWLLGFYDGDGGLKAGRYGRLYSGSEQFLYLIAETFDCIFRAKSKGKPTGFSIRESYYLVLGTELFNAMLSSFKNSMKRKCPKFH